MRLFFVLAFFLHTFLVFGQFNSSVLPDLTGPSLLDGLVGGYKPLSVVDDFTNDTLYRRIYLEPGDSLRCIYTGYAVYLAPSLDPSQAAFAGNINLEHIFPKAYGAGSGLAEDDMHHLAPSRADVNNYRGNLRFGEVNDPAADYWFFLDQTLTQIPPANAIDLFSEVEHAAFFEPREDRKGNIARAMFYFYTMYKAEADQVEPLFFESQRETLCQWHYADPVDSLEWARTYLIAAYQEGKPNPFVLDCTLPERSYCQGMGLFCDIPSGNDPQAPSWVEDFSFFPNPGQNQIALTFTLRSAATVRIVLYDAAGQLVETTFEGIQPAGTHVLDWNRQTLPPGAYFWAFQALSGEGAFSTTRQMILHP